MKLHPVGAELILCGQTAGQTHGRTDGHDVASRNFVNVPRICQFPSIKMISTDTPSISFVGYDH